MKDSLNKYLLNGCVSIMACGTTELCERARQLHATYPTATAALGRTLTAAALMGAAQLKNDDDKLTLSLNGGGPAGTVLATANVHGHVKGYIENPFVDIPARPDGKLDVGGAIGKEGFVCVVRDAGEGEPYTGSTELVSGEVAEDVAQYYLLSEQQPSIVYLGVWVETDCTVLCAGGLTIRPLPGADEETLCAIEERIHDIANYVIMLMAMTPDAAVRKIFAGMEMKALGGETPQYLCDCTRERLEKVVMALGAKEIQSIIDEDGQAELVCRFCNTKFFFDKDELIRLRDEAMPKT